MPAMIIMGTVCLMSFIAGCEPSDDSRSVDGSVTSRHGANIEKSRPNIVLITICTGRYRQFGIGGYGRPTSPFIDSLAASGVSFETAVASSSWTKPTTATILTGLTPNVHGMTDYYEYNTIISKGFEPKRTLSDDVVTIAECLKEAGYATSCRNNNIHASQFFNMTQGFDDCPLVTGQTDTPKMLKSFSDWLGSLDKKQPFFFFMLTRDAHIPYLPSYEYYRKFSRSDSQVGPKMLRNYAFGLRKHVADLEKKKVAVPDAVKRDFIDLYDAELAQLDNALREIPRILDKHGVSSNTLVILTADHGERLFGQHGYLGHSRVFMGEEVLQVPLVFSGAGIPQGVRIKDIVRTIDLYPTIASIAGADAPDMIQGRSLVPYFRGEALDAVSAFASYRGVAHVCRLGQYKLHRSKDGAHQLFDLASDPDEINDLAEGLPEIAGELAGKLDHWLEMEAELQKLVSSGETRELTPDVIERLRSLGYIQ